MRKYFLLFTILFSSPALAAAHSVTITVNGMVCAFCAQGITKKFKAEDAVRSIDVQLSQKLVKLEFKEGQSMTDAVINKILQDSGYTVVKIERN